MKKLLLAIIALTIAFAISSCCGQGQGLGRQRELEKEEEEQRQAKKNQYQSKVEELYRYEPTEEKAVERDVPERQHHRW